VLTTAADGSFSWNAMHSPISLQLPGLDDVLALAVARAVEADLEATEQALSRFRPTADLAQLNVRVGQWTAVPARLYKALAAAWRAQRLTEGLFDPRVIDRLEAYGYRGTAHDGAQRAADGELWLQRDPRGYRVRLSAPADLGGIGKGLGVRWAARIVRRIHGNFLLNAGGDLVAEGPGPEGRGWQIGIEDPLDTSDVVAALHLPRGGAVCTSSIARHIWQHEGRTVHHLIDPRTGQPGGAGLLAVTVVAEDPAWAEVWSKALFLRGASGIAEAAGARAVVWVTEGGQLQANEAGRRLVFWRARRGGGRQKE